MTAQNLAFEPVGNAGALRGLLTVTFHDVGLVVHELGLYQRTREGRVVRWTHWPARVRRGPAGERLLTPVIEPVDELARLEFQRLILEALSVFEAEWGRIG